VSQESKAKKLYTGFHEEPPEGGRKVNIPTAPAVVWELGKVLSIAYETNVNGETISYEHEFRASSAPHIAVSPDGKAMFFADGKYKVTERGITDI
jgi:alanine racemase